MSKARLFLALLACALHALNAAAGPSAPPRRNPTAAQLREEDPLWQWFNAMRSVKVYLARMGVGGGGGVAYETTEMLSENLLAMSDFRASLEGKVTGSSVAIPVTLVTDTLTAAMSGDGRGDSVKRPATRFVRTPLGIEAQ